MKKLSMLLMFVIILTAKSQDRPPSPLTFTYKVNGQTKTNEPLKRDYFKQEKFMLGTQWYGHPRMLQALNMNVQQGIQDGSGIIPNDSSATYKMYHIWDGRLYENALGFEYKPTLYIPESDRGKLVTFDIIISSESLCQK